MKPYIRFETDLPLGRNRARLGLFRAAMVLKHRFDLPDYTQELLHESLDWFNQNLKVPHFSSQNGRCIFWFRTDAERLLGQIRPLVALFNEEGLFVHKRTTSRPGMIMYSDRFQIAAIPERRKDKCRLA